MILAGMSIATPNGLTATFRSDFGGQGQVRVLVLIWKKVLRIALGIEAIWTFPVD